MQDLWDRWRENHRLNGLDPNFVCEDGIVDESKFGEDRNGAKTPRTLFVMKDTNDPTNEIKCLNRWLRQGPKYQMWHTISRWSAGILYRFPEYRSIDNWDVMHDSLQRVATINLKKRAGRSAADTDEIHAFSMLDKELLREQVTTVRPDVIVACGTFQVLLWLFELEIDYTRLYKPSYCRSLQCWIIPMRHPALAENEKTYSELREHCNSIPLFDNAVSILT